MILHKIINHLSLNLYQYDEPFYSKQDFEDNDRWLRELFLSKDERIAEIDKKIKNLEEQKQWLIDKE